MENEKRPSKAQFKKYISPAYCCNRCGVDSSDQLSHPSLSRLLNTNLGATVYLFAAIWSLIMTLPPTTRLRLPPFYIYRPPSQQHLKPINCAVPPLSIPAFIKTTLLVILAFSNTLYFPIKLS